MNTEDPWAWLKQIEINRHPFIQNPQAWMSYEAFDTQRKFIACINKMRSALERIDEPTIWLDHGSDGVVHLAHDVLYQCSRGEFE